MQYKFEVIYHGVRKQVKGTDFKNFLHHLSQAYLLPDSFTLYYASNQQERGIYIGCPADYQIYIRKLIQKEFEQVPFIQVLDIRPEIFTSKEELEKLENDQLNLSKISSDNMSQIQEQFENLSLNRSKSSSDKDILPKCQLCYQEMKGYFRCVACLDYKLCAQCNQKERLIHHSRQHQFIYVAKEGDFDHLKLTLADMILRQQKVLKFKIHSRQIHECIACDGCNMNPILGKRYKCSECMDHDLCEICFTKVNHPHSQLQMDYSVEFYKV